MHKWMKLLSLCVGLVIASEVSSLRSAFAQSYYRGKTITIMVPHRQGGASDSFARLIQRQIGRYIPGSPIVIVETKPGRSGIVLLNYMYHKARKDGTIIAVSPSYIAIFQKTKIKYTRYSAEEFGWIGGIAMYRPEELIQTPLAQSLPSSDRERRALLFGMSYLTVGSSLIAPPEIPQNRLRILRTAFGNMVRSTEFWKVWKKMKRINHKILTGDELKSYATKIVNTPLNIVNDAESLKFATLGLFMGRQFCPMCIGDVNCKKCDCEKDKDCKKTCKTCNK